LATGRATCLRRSAKPLRRSSRDMTADHGMRFPRRNVESFSVRRYSEFRPRAQMAAARRRPRPRTRRDAGRCHKREWRRWSETCADRPTCAGLQGYRDHDRTLIY
jgi:hypothetical protein